MAQLREEQPSTHSAPEGSNVPLLDPEPVTDPYPYPPEELSAAARQRIPEGRRETREMPPPGASVTKSRVPNAPLGLLQKPAREVQWRPLRPTSSTRGRTWSKTSTRAANRSHTWAWVAAGAALATLVESLVWWLSR
jgi:hypothetical protein